MRVGVLAVLAAAAAVLYLSAGADCQLITGTGAVGAATGAATGAGLGGLGGLALAGLGTAALAGVAGLGLAAILHSRNNGRSHKKRPSYHYGYGHHHGHHGGHGYHRRYGRAVDDEENLKEKFSMVSRMDQSGCGLQMVCYIFGIDEDELTEKEMAVKKLIGDYAGVSSREDPRYPYATAASLGAGGYDCAAVYAKCPLPRKAVMDYLNQMTV